MASLYLHNSATGVKEKLASGRPLVLGRAHVPVGREALQTSRSEELFTEPEPLTLGAAASTVTHAVSRAGRRPVSSSCLVIVSG